MAVVQVQDVSVLNNPAQFQDPLQFEITFDCISQLQDDIEWKLIYVGSSSSEEFDQELDSVLVGPVPVGCNKFVFQADAPDPSRVPVDELLGVTVVLLTCSYLNQEFVRIGYYVNNEYADLELRENPPNEVDLSLVVRSILADKPRVTRFPINWDDGAQGSDQPAPFELLNMDHGISGEDSRSMDVE